MIDILKNGDIVITDKKLQILEILNKKQKILNIKIMNLEEFKKRYFGYYDERAIYYLIDKYHYKYEIAKMYLNNFLFINELKEELKEKNLIIEEPMFKNNIKRIVIDVKIDQYIRKEVEKYDHIYLSTPEKKYVPTLYEFNEIEKEINFIAIKIIELLKKVYICL